MYTKEDHAMIVHFNKNKAHRFKKCGKGLYYLDISGPEIIPLTAKETVTDYSFLSNVDTNMVFYPRIY